MAFNWVCPYCDRAQSVTDDNYTSARVIMIQQKSKWGSIGLLVNSITCANASCAQLDLKVSLHSLRAYAGGVPSLSAEPHREWSLLPASSARPQPECVPKPLRDDYYEACAIRDLSPKASATLSRRCLQGMIRDFSKISKRRLIDEIRELKAQADGGTAPPGVQPDTIDAIDHVRRLGNIGAHMEADINQIVEIDAGEAQVMIELIELLFQEWYIAREERAARIKKLEALGAAKQLERDGTTPAVSPASATTSPPTS